MSVSKSKLDRSTVFSSLLGDLKGIDADVEQRHIPLEAVVLNPKQPRKFIDPVSLGTLTASVSERGVLEPILVRPVGENFELVAGERRTRAARAAGLETIPAIIRPMGDHEALEVAIIENLQREDLNPVEETDAILQLISMRVERPTSEVVEGIRSLYDEARGRSGNTRISKMEKTEVEEIFAALGRFTPSSFYTNRIPILSLPPELLEAVRKGQLEYPKARLLARVKDEDRRAELLDQVLNKSLSREQLEALIKVGGGEANSPAIESLLKRVKRGLSSKRLARLEPKQRERAKELLEELQALLS